jgi:cytochrome c556|tara:strand:+ start:267 stop:716 length:450 start_codon:yes stop_codon:yes gene_type:complete
MNIKKLFMCFNLILFFNIFSLTQLYAHEGAKGIIKERMDKFKMSKNLMKKINKGLQNDDFLTIEKSAQTLLKWSKEMPNYFPEGSDTPPSEASSDIWLDPEGFKKAIKNFELASLQLITQSQNKDFDMTVNSFRSLAKTCKGCHQKFRN